MLSLSAFLLGAAELGVVVASATLAGVFLRRRLLPGWVGPPAWLATAVLAIALALIPAELLGLVGWFDEVPYLLAMVTLTAALRFGLGEPRSTDRVSLAAPSPGTAMTLAGLAIAGLVVAHFSIGVRLSLGGGMTGFDTTWYHGPFAALFVQSGETFDLNLIAPQYLAWFYPQNSELVHSLGILAFDRDILSPLLNLGWLCGCLAAAWAIGRPFGTGPASMAGAALVLGAGALADQSGEARNDIPAIFFLLAACAIAVNAWTARRDAPSSAHDGKRSPLTAGELAVIGIAAGLAAGTKVNYLAPAGALAIGLAVLAPKRGRLRAFGWVALPAFAAGGYWYVRNLVHTGNPLPWLKDLGPLPAPDQELGGREAHGVVDYLTDFSVWADWFGPGLREGFGVLWPLLVLLAIAGVVLCLGRRAEPVLKLLATVVAVTVFAWLVAPASAEGPDGSPVGFVSGLRYLAPALALSLAMLPTAPSLRREQLRWVPLAMFAVVFPFADASAEGWHSSYLPSAVLLGLLFVMLGLGLGSRRLRSLSPTQAAAGFAALLVLTLSAGHLVQRNYLDDRYADPEFTTPGLDASFRWARSLSDTGIATTTTRQYPYFGTDLSNDVAFVGVERPHGGFVRPESCAEFVEAVNEIGPAYLVTALDRPEPGREFPPEAGWVARDPAAQLVLRREPAVVYRLSGRLDPASCPSP